MRANHFRAGLVLSISFMLGIATASSNADDKSKTVWRSERTDDGMTVLTDGTISVKFPAGAKVEVEGTYASVSIKQKTGALLEGYLSVERKDAPPSARKAADSQKWLETFVHNEVEKDRKSTYKSDKGETKNYNDVKLIKITAITLGTYKGVKAITDHERSLSNVRIEGELHSVTETDRILAGDYLYALRAGGSGAPKMAQLFGDHTGFHRSDLAQQFFKSATVAK